jgi:hypothetical protein
MRREGGVKAHEAAASGRGDVKDDNNFGEY